MDSDTQRANDARDGGSHGESANHSTLGGNGNQSSLTDQLRQQAESRFSSEKDRAVQGLTSLADAARQTGQQLREKDQLGIASYIERAADQATQFSERLANKDLGEIVDDVERFAHRQPALFLGVSFGIGLLGARFLKSSRSPAAGAARPNVTAGRWPSGSSPAGARTGYGTQLASRPALGSARTPAPSTPSPGAGRFTETDFNTATRPTEVEGVAGAGATEGREASTPRTAGRRRLEH
jgi:ElaB/YqjD/DUF883 family membrane-anchored ribosome-binding protein